MIFFKEVVKYNEFNKFNNFKFLALGNQTGKVYLWDMDVTEPNLFAYVSL